MEKIFRELSNKGMFITSDSDFETSNNMLLKNIKDEVLFKFELVEGQTMLESLKIRINKFKEEVESCF